MHYKDFIATVVYDPCDDCFVGEVCQSDGHIIFAGRSVEELHKNMAEACEGHLINLEKLKG